MPILLSLVALVALPVQDPAGAAAAVVEGFDAIKYLPESVSVTAVILVVVLFLRQQSRTAAEHRAEREAAHRACMEGRDAVVRQFTATLEQFERRQTQESERLADSLDRINTTIDRALAPGR